MSSITSVAYTNSLLPREDARPAPVLRAEQVLSSLVYSLCALPILPGALLLMGVAEGVARLLRR